MGPLRPFQRLAIQRMEKAAQIATDQASRQALLDIRRAMAGAGLGRLGNALGQTSDLAKNRVKRFGTDGFRVSGIVFTRTRSERSLGAIEAYTEGADIRPRRAGGWLWIATPNIPSRAGRFRMTPSRYRSSGLETRIGPLIEIPGRDPGERLLVVKDVTLARSGKRGSALRQKSRVGPTRQAERQIVAFVGVRHTSRAARIDVEAIIEWHRARLPELINRALGAN